MLKYLIKKKIIKMSIKNNYIKKPMDTKKRLILKLSNIILDSWYFENIKITIIQEPLFKYSKKKKKKIKTINIR